MQPLTDDDLRRVTWPRRSFPLHLDGEDLPIPGRAPEVGEHADAVLARVPGYRDADLEALRATGALG